MHSATVRQTLRPLKFAYIVRPNDFRSLRKIIETNSFLWGGRYNPVLILHKRKPKHLRQSKQPVGVDEILQGSLRFFEPDFIVTTGDIKEAEIYNPTCKIISLSEIYQNIAAEVMPAYGIGLNDVLSEYYNEQAKFVKKVEVIHTSPRYRNGHNCFLKAVFGCFPQELPQIFLSDIYKALEIRKFDVDLKNYLSYLEPSDDLNVHRLNTYKLKLDYLRNINPDKHVILILNPHSFVDVVDYINIKASGSSIYPVTIDHLKSEDAKRGCLDYIEEFAWVHPDNPHSTHPVAIQCGSSVTKDSLEPFIKSLNVPKFDDSKFSKCTISYGTPQFWNTLGQNEGRVTCSNFIADIKETEILLHDEYLKIRSISPSFLSERIPRPYKPRYANDIGISSYTSSSKEFNADILPSNSPEVARAAGLLDLREWLIKPSTISKLCRSEDSLIFVQIHNAEKIFLSWLKSEGWDARVSDAGKVAYQMLKHLGGPGNLTFLKGEKLIRFLVGKNDLSTAIPRTSPLTGISNQEFRGKAKEAYNDHYVHWGEDSFIKHFFDHNILKLGTDLKCDVCSRSSWHAIDNLQYAIDCPHCLDSFELPSHSPDDIKWSYKTIGPFSAAGKAAGAYSVLLTAAYFNNNYGIGDSTTTILSFEAERDSTKIEADLGLFYRKNSNWDRTTETIFAECKIYRNFTKKDVNKMKVLAKAFPNSVLVFATLNKKLNDREQKLLIPFVKQCNKEGRNGRPKNPVLILTATELFARNGPPYCWKNKGGRYKPYEDAHYLHRLLETCQATQKIYLNLDSWHRSWSY